MVHQIPPEAQCSPNALGSHSTVLAATVSYIVNLLFCTGLGSMMFTTFNADKSDAMCDYNNTIQVLLKPSVADVALQTIQSPTSIEVIDYNKVLVNN